MNFWRHYYLGLDQQTRSADYDALATYACLRASTGQRFEVDSVQRGQVSAVGFRHDCLSERVFGVDFDSGSVGKQITLVGASYRRDFRHCRGPACERSGLIENHHVQIAGAFECESVLDEQTVLSPERCRDCNHEWNRQSQGVGASNDEHGCRSD